MMTGSCYTLIELVMVLTVAHAVMTAPSRRFLVDCLTPVICDKKGPLACGTDRHTYANMCTLDREAQLQLCRLNILNPVAYLHDGSCHYSP